MPLDNSYIVSPREFPIFDWNRNAFGGTEYMVTSFYKKILSSLPKLNNYQCYVMPGNMPELPFVEASDKEIIFWMHNTIYQFNPEMVKKVFNGRIISKIKYIVVVSEFQKQETLKHLPIDESKVVVIPNAIEPLTYDSSKFDKPSKVKIVHTSTAERGTPVLLNALTKIDRDFRLEIYNDFYPHNYDGYEPDPRIRFYGRTPKATVIEAIENSHIHAYPSIYPETFCLSQAEAMSAGLLCLTSDIGSLPEVSGGHTRIYPYEEDQIKHMETYAELLTKAIDDVANGNWNPEEQIKYVNSEYSWERHKERWLELHDKL